MRSKGLSCSRPHSCQGAGSEYEPGLLAPKARLTLLARTCTGNRESTEPERNGKGTGLSLDVCVLAPLQSPLQSSGSCFQPRISPQRNTITSPGSDQDHRPRMGSWLTAHPHISLRLKDTSGSPRTGNFDQRIGSLLVSTSQVICRKVPPAPPKQRDLVRINPLFDLVSLPRPPFLAPWSSLLPARPEAA